MTMRTTIKLTWDPDISMGDYADALLDIAHAIELNNDNIADVRSFTEAVPATKERKIRKKREPYHPPAERGGEPVEE